MSGGVLLKQIRGKNDHLTISQSSAKDSGARNVRTVVELQCWIRQRPFLPSWASSIH